MRTVEWKRQTQPGTGTRGLLRCTCQKMKQARMGTLGLPSRSTTTFKLQVRDTTGHEPSPDQCMLRRRGRQVLGGKKCVLASKLIALIRNFWIHSFPSSWRYMPRTHNADNTFVTMVTNTEHRVASALKQVAMDGPIEKQPHCLDVLLRAQCAESHEPKQKGSAEPPEQNLRRTGHPERRSRCRCHPDTWPPWQHGPPQ